MPRQMRLGLVLRQRRPVRAKIRRQSHMRAGEECLSDSCKNGICNLTLNSPCVDGDPCQCVFGFCTQQCDGTFTDYRGGCPYGFACTDGYHPVQDPDVNTGRGWCHRECQDDPAACAAGQQCGIPPDYFSSTRIRACLWH